MPKRKKYPKLPNGYGTIRYLGKNRRNCYAVHPPAVIEEGTGRIIRQKPLCYVDAWIKGFTVLTAYKAGTYTPDMEKTLEIGDTDDLTGLSQRILADYSRSKGIEEPVNGKTFSEVYEEFFKWKYESGKEYSKASKDSTRAAFKNCSSIHDREFASLKYDDLQGVIDNCTLRYASLELIVSLFKQMYQYSDIKEYSDKNYAEHIRIKKGDDDEHGVPFSENELKLLWDHKEDPVAEFLLIMCYSGYRISAYRNMEVNIKERYFKGGVKTKASKERIVPIHSAILPLVKTRIKRDGCLIKSAQGFRANMKDYASSIGLSSHTPHDCRHTFSALCEKYGVRENDRKRMLGHTFGDVTNDVYGHRELTELRNQIEKIKV